ncbi:ABC transporter permease subunit [Rhodobacteraceae bacterium 2CG4]|uniref:ABC transporter permease subunit n=1 Tax=Halovulum marinum TaxID=2662447 RepID=A0A6L5YZT1_9RHOB|nr:ABC transporter permease subunit [Halovulum marinum]MSU89771.1 ABC transporter permease subunit [Halovulum marinum]
MNELLPFLPLLLRGAAVTLALALLGLALATALGALGAVGRLSGRRLPAAAVRGYTALVRGVPDLVMVLLVYFGGQRLLNDLGALVGLDRIPLPPFWAGVLSIGFIYGAYLTETFRGAYRALPAGQADAARALGLGRGATLRLVLLPQMLRHALPGYANVWMVLVKSTAVVSVIGLGDLVGVANDVGKSQRAPFLFFGFVLLVYLGITWVSGRLFAAAERRAAR